MRLPSKKDDEMLKTIKMSARSSGREKMLEYFRNKAKNSVSDADPWFYNALMAWETVMLIKNPIEITKLYREVINCCGNALSIEKLHWPSMYLRSSALTLGKNTSQDSKRLDWLGTDYTLESAVKERADMIELQKASGMKPFYIVPYLVMSYAYLCENETGLAEDWLRKGLAETSAANVDYLSGILFMPGFILYNKLIEIENSGLAVILARRHNILFPGRKIIQTVKGHIL